MDALDYCKKDKKCKVTVDHLVSEVFNAKYLDLYSKVKGTWTDEDWDELDLEVEEIYNISMKPLNRSREFYILVDTFYEEFELNDI